MLRIIVLIIGSLTITNVAAEKEDESITAAVKQEFEDKLSSLPQGARQYLIDSYANPVKNIG